MRPEGTKEITIEGAFSKGIIQDLGSNRANPKFGTETINMRITNGILSIRKGTRSNVVSSIGTFIKGLVSNTNLFACVDSKFQQIDLDAGTFTSKGSIGVDTACNFITFGKFTIILIGSGFPFLYDGTTLTQLTATNIEVGADPIFGTKFANFTFVSGNGTDKTNVLYISRGITAAAQTLSHDWEGAGSEKIVMKSPILGLSAGLNRLYIFTETSIEFLDKGSLTDVGGTVSFYTSPIGTGDRLASHRSIVVAGDAVFYITKNRSIKTINYLEGSIELSIGDLSSRPGQSIQGLLDNLDEDQSESFGYFEKEDNLVIWGLKSNTSTVNDVILIYDITNDTFVTDNGYFFSTMETHNGRAFGGGMFNSNIILYNDLNDDDGFGIEWKRKTAKLDLGNPSSRKSYRGVNLTGQLNALATINIDIEVDGSIVVSDEVIGSLEVDGIGNNMIGDTEIGGSQQVLSLTDFTKLIGRGDLNDRGKYLQAIYSGNTAGELVSLEYMSVTAKGIGTDEVKDK